MNEYTPADKMRDIIADNNLLLMALSRFGIPLGFGDMSISKVCGDSGVDCNTFLAVANMISNKQTAQIHKVSLPALIGYLKSAHAYFLDFILPTIRRKLIDAISHSDAGRDLTVLILQFYDDYVSEVRRHMDYENEVVFDYVEALLRGERPVGFCIARFEANHKPIANKLHELKDIFICHYSEAGGRIDMLNSTLFDIITCEHDLMSHCRVEDDLFVPAVQSLEQSLEVTTPAPEPVREEPPANELSEREKDVVRAVAKGLSNKEIAERLCLSVHTVTTHRRNISAKLDIHSAPGLTIYAIIHNLLSIDEIQSLQK